VQCVKEGAVFNVLDAVGVGVSDHGTPQSGPATPAEAVADWFVVHVEAAVGLQINSKGASNITATFDMSPCSTDITLC